MNFTSPKENIAYHFLMFLYRLFLNILCLFLLVAEHSLLVNGSHIKSNTVLKSIFPYTLVLRESGTSSRFHYNLSPNELLEPDTTQVPHQSYSNFQLIIDVYIQLGMGDNPTC